MARKHVKHRKRSRQAKKFTALGAATVTATALTVGSTPLPDLGPDPDPKKLLEADVALAAAINEWPEPGQLPDLTGGLGTAGYDLTQTVVEVVVRAVVENFNLAAVAQAAGLDPRSLVEGLLGDPDFLINEVLGGVLGEIPIDLSPVLDAVVGELVTNTILIPVLQLLGVTNAQGVTDLLSLLGLVGLDLSDPLNLANLDIPGLNVITASPVFTALKLLGVDLGWVPSLPNAVAGEINNTDYLEVGVNGLLTTLLEDLSETLPGNPLIPLLQGVINGLTGGLPDVVHLRVPVSVGVGMGAFALATGYDKVLADLANQPGGANYTGVDPLLGSITVLPMLLAFNPARPNGGALARFYPLFDLFGINTVNPETEVSSSGGLLQLPLGLSVGGANLIPILIDLGVQYHPSSDFAAWPNPFSLANNLVAGVLPTYILRGITLDTVTEQLGAEIEEAFANIGAGNPLSLNLYLTLPSATQPVLEPLYLLSDFISIASLGALSVNPVSMFANALAPAIEALNNLGYTDVVRNPDGTYTRTLTEAGDPTPFFSFPAGINPVQVVVDVANLLVRGFQKEFFSGNPTPATPNVILNLFDLLTGGDVLGNLPLGNLAGLLQGIIDQLNPLAQTQQAQALAEATDVPSAEARMVTLSTTDESDEQSLSETADSGAAPEEEPSAEEPTEEEPTEEEPTEEEPTEEEPTDEEPTDEEPTDEEPTEEEPTEEEPADEDAGDDEVDEEESDEDESDEEESEEDSTATGNSTVKTGPRHAKPDNGQTVTSVSGNAPRHAKPDNDTTGGDTTGDKSDGASGAAA